MQKKPPSSKTRANTGSAENRNSSGSCDSAVAIPAEESQLFVKRLKEIIGEEPLRAFARRCHMTEGALRSYLAGSSFPGMLAIVAMADAGNVTVEWLVTGREPRTRAELRALVDRAGAYADSFGPVIDKDRLLMAIRMATDALLVLGEPLTAERQADLVATFYQRLEGSGPMPKLVQK